MKTLRLLVLIVSASMTLGCTADKLKFSTIDQGATLTEVHYAQVLNNVAMFCSNPEFVPSFINMRDGSCQIADLGSASYMGDWHWAFGSHPNVLGSRTVVEQWGMDPVIDDNELQLLQIAYRRAIGIDESLEEHRDLANDVAHELVNQLPEVDDYRGSIVNQFEDFKNEERRRSGVPGFDAGVGGVLSYVYPTSHKPTHSIAKDFSDQTISSADNKIIYDNEFLRYINVWGLYRQNVQYKDRTFFFNSDDYEDDLKHPETTRSKLRLPAPTRNPHGEYDLNLSRPRNTGDIPARGESLIVVADVNNVLHFRVFEDDGKLVVNTDEIALMAAVAVDPEKREDMDGKIRDLKATLGNLWTVPHRTENEKNAVITMVSNIVGYSTHGYVYFAVSDSALIRSSKVTYVTPEAAAVRRQIKDLENDLLSIPCDRAWFGQGGKRDIPKDACFVGHYKDCYVWVRADGLKDLSNLTIKTLKISNLIKSDSVMTIPGPRFTPASGFTAP